MILYSSFLVGCPLSLAICVTSIHLHAFLLFWLSEFFAVLMLCCRFEWFFFDAVDGVVKKPEFTPDPKKPALNSAEKHILKGVTKNTVMRMLMVVLVVMVNLKDLSKIQ